MRLELDFQQTTVADTPDPQAVEEVIQDLRLFSRVCLPGDLRCPDPPLLGRRRKFRMFLKLKRSDCHQRQGFTLQDLGAGLDVVVHVSVGLLRHHIAKGEDVGILPVDFHPGRRHIHCLHFEGCDGDDGHHGQQDGQDQPLVLAQNDQVVAQVGLARNPPGQRIVRGNENCLDSSCRFLFARKKSCFPVVIMIAIVLTHSPLPQPREVVWCVCSPP